MKKIKKTDRVFFHEIINQSNINSGFGIVLDIIKLEHSKKFKPDLITSNIYSYLVAVLLTDKGSIEEMLVADCKLVEEW